VSDNLHLAIVFITEFADALYRQGSVTIEIIPDDILLETFCFYVMKSLNLGKLVYSNG